VLASLNSRPERQNWAGADYFVHQRHYPNDEFFRRSAISQL
jgi:hypothetical protein